MKIVVIACRDAAELVGKTGYVKKISKVYNEATCCFDGWGRGWKSDGDMDCWNLGLDEVVPHKSYVAKKFL